MGRSLILFTGTLILGLGVAVNIGLALAESN